MSRLKRRKKSLRAKGFLQPDRSEDIYLKSPSEIGRMREAGHLLHRILHEVAQAAQEGVTTLELDRLAYDRIIRAKARPAFLNLYGFPATLCISLNEVVVHGFPTKDKLREGDLLSFDCGLHLNGYCADSAYTVPIGKISEEAQRLLDVTKQALYVGIEAAAYQKRVGEIGEAVQDFVEGKHGMHCIRNYAGHGVGRSVHEAPQVFNYRESRGPRIGNGLTIAIEPMVALGTGETEQLDDGWTVLTADRSLAAHYEHTVAITKEGVEVLTRDPEVNFF